MENQTNVKRGFIRALWGVYDHQGKSRFWTRREKVDNDIELVLNSKYSPPFMTYVFGKDNYSYLVDKGVACKLIDDKPILWDMDTQQFRHKLEVFKAGMEDLDEIIFLDWDCIPIKPVPDYLWETLGKKAPIQAILRQYFKRKANWRKIDMRKVPCASFVYIRDKKIPLELIRIWEELGRPWSEETVMAKYIDDLMGGWKGLDQYWDLYEPTFFVLPYAHVYSEEQRKTKDVVFNHFNARGVATSLRMIRGNTANKFKWLK